MALLRITCGEERLQYQVSAVIRIPTPFAAKGGGRPRIYLPCSRHIFLSHPCPENDILQRGRRPRERLAKLPSRKEATAEFLDANKPTSIHPHFFWGHKSNVATQQGKETQPQAPNTWRYHQQVAAGVACALPRSLGRGGKNKIIWQSVLFAPPERLDGVYGPAKRFWRSHCSQKGIRVYLLHFCKH